MTSVSADDEAIGDRLRARAAQAGRLERGNGRFRFLTLLAAAAVVAIFIGMFVALLIGASPALRTFGFNFLITDYWNPVTEKFGIRPLIVGTLATSALAMLIATPVGIGHRNLLDRTLSALFAQPDRDRNRASGRHPQHHLRHLGLVRLRALVSENAAAGIDRRLREHPCAEDPLRRPP